MRGVPENPTATRFRLTWRAADEPHDLSVEGFGCVRVVRQAGASEAHLPFPGQGVRLASAEPDGTWLLETLTRNQVPLYLRRRGTDAVMVANDLTLLIDEGEDIGLHVLTLLSLVTNSARTVFSNLFEGIELLLPASHYRVSRQPGGVDVALSGIAFDELPRRSPAEVLEQIVESYRQANLDADHVALGLSGGYDSRFELAIYKTLGKRVTALHHTTSRREGHLAAQVADTAGAHFVAVPTYEAAERGWDRLQHSGFTTRWDGFFAPGTPASWGLIDAAPPDADGIRLLTAAPLKGLLYDRRMGVEDWLAMGRFSALQHLTADVPALRTRAQDAWEQRRSTVASLTRMVADTIERDDVRTDVLYFALYKSSGRSAGRVGPFVEAGMPMLTAQRSNREAFSALPVQDKQDSQFLQLATATLQPELAALPRITSSDNTVVRALGPLGRLPGVKYLSRWVAPTVGMYDFHRPVDGRDTLLDDIPQLPAVVRMAAGKPSMMMSMTVQLLARLQHQHRIRYHLDDPDGLDALLDTAGQ